MSATYLSRRSDSYVELAHRLGTSGSALEGLAIIGTGMLLLVSSSALITKVLTGT